MELYLLRKRNISLIRAGKWVKEAEAEGYELLGRCDKDGNLLPQEEKEKPEAKKKVDK
jgi:hypothetical protein